MNILGIIVNLLAIIVVYHAYDPKRAKQFHENVDKCRKLLNKTSPEINAEVLLCTLTKDGRIIDHDSIVSREMRHFIMDITPYEQLAKSSQNLYDICSTNARYLNYTSRDKMKYIIKCSLPIVTHSLTLQWIR